MPINRYFSDQHLQIAAPALITGQEFHHFSNVVRTKEGELVELVNGKGVLATGLVTKKTRHEAYIEISDVKLLNPPTSNVTLVQAIPKSSKIEQILEKCTELGSSSFILFTGDKSEKGSFSKSQLERFEYVLISAMKQSGRLYLPEIVIRRNLEECFSSDNSFSFFGDVLESAKPFIHVLKEEMAGKEHRIFIGPEGGFSEKETQFLRSQSAIGVKLSNNILRTETASITAVAIHQHYFLEK